MRGLAGTTGARWGSSLILAAFLYAFAGLILPDAAQGAASSVAGTAWEGKVGKVTSTVTFGTDGTWTDVERKKKHEGTWKVGEDSSEIIVTRKDKVVIRYKLEGDTLTREKGSVVYQRSDSSAKADQPNTAGAAPVPAARAPTVKLTPDEAAAVVLIKGDTSEGTGFLIRTPTGPVVVTNLHVISDNLNVKITTNTGVSLKILSYKGATDRDLAMISVRDGAFSYLTPATEVSRTAQPGDEVITPGNSEGGEVMLNTGGKVLGIGPQRVEFDNPVYHGNSGGPVYHVKSHQVIGVVTAGYSVDVSNALDRASFASRNSAITGSMRYFGLRLDTVPGWETYDMNRFENETAFLEQFDKENRCLDCYINAPHVNQADNMLWLEDPRLVKANNDYFDTNALYSDLRDIVALDMDTIQDPKNFYSFQELRAQDEIAYRNAIKAELENIAKGESSLNGLRWQMN
jgi:S1-C subfamily serine protease